VSPRLAKFDQPQIVAAAARLIATSGLEAATVAGIAQSIGAPVGSIYHRFDSRSDLIAEVWLNAATAFQREFFERLRSGAPYAAGLHAALYVAERVRSHQGEARILLMHRREDFINPACSAHVRQRAEDLGRQVRDELRRFAVRLTSKHDKRTMETIAYAAIEAPVAIVRPAITKGERPSQLADVLIDATYRAAIGVLNVVGQ
jgi:AcrR family transcriptional regulator